MNEPSFDVLGEPWIPAIDAEGEEREYGLLDLLAEAHRLQEITDSSPPIQFGVYRLLVVFVQSALSMFEYEDLEDMLMAGRFERRDLEDYVERVGIHRFNLFDDRAPFLQTAPTPGDHQKPHSIVKLFYQFPAGTNVTHFFHMEETEHAVSPAAAVRALCSIAPFMMSGGAGYSPSINGTPPWYVLVRGENLFETILLNCCAMEIPGLQRDGVPAWMDDTPMKPRAAKEADSLAEGFTWQPRQVRLLPSDGGTCTYTGKTSPVLIREMVWGPGFKFDGHERWVDPNVAYVHDRRRGSLPLRPRQDRQLWRDYGPLFLLKHRQGGEQSHARPLVVEQLARLKDEEILSSDAAERVEAYGMRVDKAKVFEWQFERLPLPTGVLMNPEAGAQVQHAMNLAEEVAKGLYGALKRLHPRDGGGNPQALNRVIEAGQQRFWVILEDRFHREYLTALADQKQGDQASRQRLLHSWKSILRAVGWEAFHSVMDAVGQRGEALQRQVVASDAFASTLARILKDTETG